MSCEDALALMSAKLDGALSPEEEQALAAHLEACPDCRAWMEAMASVEEKVAALAEPAPEGLKKGVLYRIDQASGKAKTPVRRWFGPGTALGAVAAVLVLLVGLGVIPLKNKTRVQDAAPEGHAVAVPQTEAPLYPEINGSFYALPAETERWINPYEGQNDGQQSMSPDTVAATWEAETPSDAVKGPQEAAPSQSDVEPASEPDGSEASASEELRLDCARLSQTEDAMVLLYTDFDPESLFELLEDAEPRLYALTQTMQTVEENGLLCCQTDCGTALAIQEWLVANLPASPEDDIAQSSAERRMKSRMEALDPGSSNLYRIIRFSQSSASVAWPESWPADWAQRLRTEENWALFYPAEDYAPQTEAPALLVFPAE